MLFGVDGLTGVDVFLLSLIIGGLMINAAVITAVCVSEGPRVVRGVRGFCGAQVAHLRATWRPMVPVFVRRA